MTSTTYTPMKILFVSDENKSEIVEEYDSLGELDFSGEERNLMNRARHKFVKSDERNLSKSQEAGKSFHFSNEDHELENLMKRVKNKEKEWNKATDTGHEQANWDTNGRAGLSKYEDTRERIRNMLHGDFNVSRESYEFIEPGNPTSPSVIDNTNRPQRVRRNVFKDFQRLYRLYDKRKTTEWLEWRNVSGTMKKFPTFIADFITRNKHFKIVKEAQRKLKKQEIIQRYNEKSEKLKKRYQKNEKYNKDEMHRVKGKATKKKERPSDNVFEEFMRPANKTFINNQFKPQLCDGMSGSQSELYYPDGHTLTTIGFDSDKTVESNYINETLIKQLGLKLNARERKELNKNLKKFEVIEHETLAPHFYEDYREDIFLNEEAILEQRATPLDLMDGLQLLPYVLREKTLPPTLQKDNTLEEVIRNCRHLDLENFRKLGEQKLAHYVLKVHDRRRRRRNITRPTTPKDDSLLSREDEEAFMKKITLKTDTGRLLYDHEKLYDKIIRNKFKYKKVIYNDSLCWAYRELTPLAPVYITIVPKKNLTSLGEAGEEDAFLLGHMFHLCSKLAFNLKMRDGYRVVINDGYAGNHNLTHLNILLIGGRQMKYPKYYDLSHFNEDKSWVDYSLSTYGDNFQLSGRMADFLGSYGSLRERRAKWLLRKFPKMQEDLNALHRGVSYFPRDKA